MIPNTLPALPPAGEVPWSAEIIEAHRTLCTTFLASRRALGLDESDPIRLGHHCKQAEAFMISIVDALHRIEDNPLPEDHIRTVREAVVLLADGLRIAHKEATSA